MIECHVSPQHGTKTSNADRATAIKVFAPCAIHGFDNTVADGAQRQRATAGIRPRAPPQHRLRGWREGSRIDIARWYRDNTKCWGGRKYVGQWCLVTSGAIHDCAEIAHAERFGCPVLCYPRR